MNERPAGALRVGVVGTGCFGRNHVRVMRQLAGAELATVLDADRAVAEAVAAEAGCVVAASLEELAERVDAAVVAVPTTAHAEVGCRLLELGLHVLVEKPLASSLAEADDLVRAAGDRVLAVGHVEYYNPAVQALLGLKLPPGFVEVDRMAAFTPRSLDIDVVLDLMIHDLQILQALDPSPLRQLGAVGVRVLSDKVDIANIRLELESGCVANITASRVSQERIRKLRGFFPRSYYSLDYHEQTVEGVRLEEGADGRHLRSFALPVAGREPLQAELEAFVASCAGVPGPLVRGEDGRRSLALALRIMDEIDTR